MIPTQVILVKQYEGSSAEIGEILTLSKFNEYCPPNSLRGYSIDEILSNECWKPY